MSIFNDSKEIALHTAGLSLKFKLTSTLCFFFFVPFAPITLLRAILISTLSIIYLSILSGCYLYILEKACAKSLRYLTFGFDYNFSFHILIVVTTEQATCSFEKTNLFCKL